MNLRIAHPAVNKQEPAKKRPKGSFPNTLRITPLNTTEAPIFRGAWYSLRFKNPVKVSW